MGGDAGLSIAAARLCICSPEHPIPRHEGFQHVRNERQGVDFFTVGL